MKLEDLTAFGEKDLEIPRRAEEISKNYLDVIHKQTDGIAVAGEKLQEKFISDLKKIFSDEEKYHIKDEIDEGIKGTFTVTVKKTNISFDFKKNHRKTSMFSKIYQMVINRGSTEAFINIEVTFEDAIDLYILPPIPGDLKNFSTLQQSELITMENDTSSNLENFYKIQNLKEYKYYIVRDEKRVSGVINEGSDLKHIIERAIELTEIFKD